MILDDSFTLRYVLRAFVSLLAQSTGVNLSVHTSEDGVQGLGYIFTTDPNIIIIDTTLPKYSGREIIDFLASNPKYRKGTTNIVLTHDGYIPLDLPKDYIVLNKQDKQFLQKLLQLILDIFKAQGAVPYAYKLNVKLLWFGQITAYFGNLIDLFSQKIAEANLLVKVAVFIPWIAAQIVSSILLVAIRILVPQNRETNIQQSQRDIMRFRIRNYPTIVGLMATLILVFIQISAFIAGGVTIFRISDRISESAAAYGNGYYYRRTITIQESQIPGSTALTNFPVLINGTYSYLATTANGGRVRNANGFDIIFTSDSAGSTRLDHEIERYVASTGEIVMWVEIPSLSATANTTIYMFYGNPGISTTQENENGTWNTNYRLVQHLEEGTTGATDFRDSTSNANHSNAVVIGGTGSNANATGRIGPAVQFDGSNDYIRFADSTSLDRADTWSISLWMNADSLPPTNFNAGLFGKTGNISSESAGTQINYLMYLDNGLSGSGHWLAAGFENSTHTDYRASNNFTHSTGTWYHIVSVFDNAANTITIYRNGTQVQQATSITGVPSANNQPAYIAVDNAGALSAFSGYFDGIIDEVRFSIAAHSADWVAAEYNNQNTPSSFYTVGSEETQSAVTVSSTGSQVATVNVNSTGNYIGGAFVISSTTSLDITGVTIAEQGTINGQTGLDNIKLQYSYDVSAPYDCASESFGTAEGDYGSTDTDGFSGANGTSSFSAAGISVSANQSLCLFVSMDVTSSALDGETIEIQITNPSTDVSVSADTVSPTSVVGISGTTTVDNPTDITVTARGTQTASINGSSANQYVGGAFVITEGTSSRNVTSITIREQGTVDGQSGLDNIKLFYELDSSAPYDCASESYAGSETQYGSTDTDGFSGPNGTATFTGSVSVSTTSTMCVYVVLDVTSSPLNAETIEIDIANASSDVVVSGGGIVSPSGAVVISGSTSISVAVVTTVATGGTQISAVSALVTNTHIGGYFSFLPSGGTTNITAITISEQGTVNGQTGLDNIKLYYDTDTTAPYDCASETYAGTESQFGSTDADGFSAANGTSTFSGSVAASPTQAICIYVVLDVTGSAGNAETIDIQITNPSSDVTASTGTVTPGTAVAISGNTSVVNSTVTLNLQVSATTDSAYDTVGDGTLYTTSPLRFGGLWASTAVTAGIRFNNVTVPNGATITDARVDLKEAWGGDYGTGVKIKLYGEDADNSATFSTGSLPRDRTKTTASVDWDSNGTMVAVNNWYSTSVTSPPPNIATLIQEIVDRGSWASGNSLSIIAANDGSSNDYWFEAYSYAGGAANAPKLSITYVSTTTILTVSSTGSQTSSLNGSTTNQYVGGTFVLTPSSNDATITGITLTENGTVNASTGLDNIKLFYELDTTNPYNCASESYAGSETQFGSTDTDGFSAANGTSAFTGSVAVTTTQAMCVYAVLDITGSASNGDTIELQISNPSAGGVTVSSGVVSTASDVTLSGTTTISANTAPVVTGVSLNSGNNINLTENSNTEIQVTATVTDANGYTDISSNTGRLYRSGVSGAQACSLNDNNCYQPTNTQLSGCSGNSCTLTLTYNVKFFAEPTDTGTYSSEYWLAWVQSTDASALSGTAFSANGVNELNTLVALNISGSLNYGTVLPNENTGSTNQTSTVYNTGNVTIDVQISGSNLCTDYPTCSGSTIGVANQEYSLSTFTYGAGTDLSSSPVTLQTNLSKSTALPSNSSTTIYWGIAIPNLLAPGTYSGTNTLVAVQDS